MLRKEDGIVIQALIRAGCSKCGGRFGRDGPRRPATIGHDKKR